MLTIDDLTCNGFDVQMPVERKIKSRTGRGYESVIEGVTTTNNFNTVGFTYHLSDGELLVMSTNNERLYKGVVLSYEEFNNKLKYVDRKIRKKGL